MMASVGLDKMVNIWNGYTFGEASVACSVIVLAHKSLTERLRKLDLHGDFVKGVCWDPVGNYLATQVRLHVFTSPDPFSPTTRL